MDCLPPPEPLVLTNTPADNWKKFRQRIELYFKATETNKKRTPAQKAAIFLHVAGPEAIEQCGYLDGMVDRLDVDYIGSQANLPSERLVHTVYTLMEHAVVHYSTR
ncbi:hypothetical protein MRX96_036255 [Rhipicephalus microplus]